MTSNSRPKKAGADWRAAASGIFFVVIRVLPIALGYAAYEVAASNNAKPTNTDDLLNLVVALTVAIATYVVLSEFSLRRLNASVKDVESELGKLVAVSGIEIIYDRTETLTKARALHRNAIQKVDAMWTLFPYREELKAYFADTLKNPELHTTRVIAIADVDVDSLVDHLLLNYELIATKRYEIFLIDQCNYEAMVIDDDRAGLFIYSSQGYGSAFFSSNDRGFVNAMQGLIVDLKERSTKVQLRLAPAGERFNLIHAFLQTAGVYLDKE